MRFSVYCLIALAWILSACQVEDRDPGTQSVAGNATTLVNQLPLEDCTGTIASLLECYRGVQCLEMSDFRILYSIVPIEALGIIDKTNVK